MLLYTISNSERRLLHAHDAKASLCLPIIGKKDVLGVVTIESSKLQNQLRVNNLIRISLKFFNTAIFEGVVKAGKAKGPYSDLMQSGQSPVHKRLSPSTCHSFNSPGASEHPTDGKSKIVPQFRQQA